MKSRPCIHPNRIPCIPGREAARLAGAAKLVRTIAENYKLPYYTISPTYSVCSTHGYLTGEHFMPDMRSDAEVQPNYRLLSSGPELE